MSSDFDLGEIFKNWQELNEKVGASFGEFDFDTIKKIRKQQRTIEDQVYAILLESAPDNIKKILPEDCGDMEIGYNINENVFTRAVEFSKRHEFELRFLHWLFDADRDGYASILHGADTDDFDSEIQAGNIPKLVEKNVHIDEFEIYDADKAKN